VPELCPLLQVLSQEVPPFQRFVLLKLAEAGSPAKELALPQGVPKRRTARIPPRKQSTSKGKNMKLFKKLTIKN
jgi:hypothetical protein